MLLKRNLLESITIISCCGTLFGISLNYVTNISPITGIWFPIYIIIVFVLSVLLSVKFIQWLLQLNKPIKYDLGDLVVRYPGLGFLWQVLPQPRKVRGEECREYDTNELSVISTVLERKLVSSWYVPYISQEIGFPFACKQMLDQMIGRCFQICNKIETKEVCVDICSVLISHLKEYKKAIKRHEKSPDISIESLYKTSHLTSNDLHKNYQSADHCTNVLRIILKELVPWELWDTPHSELLVRILSKKLFNFIDNTLTDPQWLNDKLLTILQGGNSPKNDIKVEKVGEDAKEIPKEDIKETKQIPKTETTVESALSTLVTKTTAPILQRDIKLDSGLVQMEKVEDILEVGVDTTEPLDIKTSPVLRQRRGRQGMKEVKIYDRVIEGSVKTWETDIDLQCISLGQDLLASLNGEITLSRLWGQDAESDAAGRGEQPLWFGEEDTVDMDLSESKEPSPVKKEHSPKPAELLKEIQTTVCQAKSKIGDLQVEHTVVDVPRNSNDEAAGMMEGLLDFGIAGLKKGLRFTGLGDDLQEKSPSHRKKSEEHSPPFMDVKSKPLAQVLKEAGSIVSPREENGISTVPPLVKQQRVASQDSVASQAKPILKDITPLLEVPDSPEPEYEEAADLSTSIAKLRCLLQQRADTSPSSERKGEEIWWEGAEETRGRTQQRHSSRPVDSATLADEYDMNAERITSPGHTSNNMQRLDRLFQRTVTGVFNSIKTAVGAEGEPAAPAAPAQRGWALVCAAADQSVGGAVARLVGSRRAYSHVDAALDSLDQLTPPPARNYIAPEDFEEWVAAEAGAWGAGAALAAEAARATHLAHRLAALLCADVAESLIEVYLEELTTWLRRQVFQLFEDLAAQDAPAAREPAPGDFSLDQTCAAVMDKIPAVYLFGEETLGAAVRLSVSSLSHKELNRDVLFRVLDLFAMHFKNAAGLRNPSFDAN